MAICLLSSKALLAATTEEEIERLGAEGVQAYQAGRLAEAQAKLRQAFAASHYPTVGVALGRTLEALGRPAEAFEVFLSVETRPLTAAAPRIFQEAQVSAGSERARLSKSVGFVQLQVRGEPNEKVQLSVDGQPREYPATGMLAVAPGSVVVAAASSSKQASQWLSIVAGQTAELTLDLASGTPPPTAPAPDPAPLSQPAVSAPPSAEKPATSSTGQAPFKGGFELGGRLVLGFPFGQSYDDTLSGGWSGDVIGLGVEASYRLGPHWSVGGFVQLAWSFTGMAPACKSAGNSCSSWDRRLGVHAQYRFSGGEPRGGWVAASLGYEWLTNRVYERLEDLTQEATFAGFELLGLHGGYDWQLGRVSFGPAATLTLGRFGDPSTSCAGPTCYQYVQTSHDSAFHYWLFVGGRVAFLIGR
jgi:hypothetical protein